MDNSNWSLHSSNRSLQFTIPTLFNIFYSITLTLTGLLGFLGSVLVVVVIIKSKELWSPCFQLIAAAACGSLISSIYYFVRGINQLGIMWGIFSQTRKSWICILPVTLFGYLGQPFQCLVTCAIACDRMVSLVAPIRYRHLNRKYSIVIILSCTFIVMIQDIAALVASPLHKIIVCVEFSDAVNTTFRRLYTALFLFYYFLTVLFYLVMLMCLRLGQKSNEPEGRNEEVVVRQHQMAVMPAIKLMMVAYSFTGVLGESLINAARYMESQPVSLPLRRTGTLLRTLGCLVEAIALITRSTKFRECCLSVLHLKQSPIMETHGNSNEQRIQGE